MLPGNNKAKTNMDLMLKGKVVLITGPAKGMGAAITKAFAVEGSRLALIGRDVAAIEPVAAEARSIGAEAITLPDPFKPPVTSSQSTSLSYMLIRTTPFLSTT
jgi:hypothetical protein